MCSPSGGFQEATCRALCSLWWENRGAQSGSPQTPTFISEKARDNVADLA